MVPSVTIIITSAASLETTKFTYLMTAYMYYIPNGEFTVKDTNDFLAKTQAIGIYMYQRKVCKA